MDLREDRAAMRKKHNTKSVFHAIIIDLFLSPKNMWYVPMLIGVGIYKALEVKFKIAIQPQSTWKVTLNKLDVTT